jgi:hypothetical protein
MLLRWQLKCLFGVATFIETTVVTPENGWTLIIVYMMTHSEGMKEMTFRGVIGCTLYLVRVSNSKTEPIGGTIKPM